MPCGRALGLNTQRRDTSLLSSLSVGILRMMRETPICNRRQLLAAGLAVPFVVRPYGLALALAERSPMLSGTFLQLLTEHHTWRVGQRRPVRRSHQRLQHRPVGRAIRDHCLEKVPVKAAADVLRY